MASKHIFLKGGFQRFFRKRDDYMIMNWLYIQSLINVSKCLNGSFFKMEKVLSIEKTF